MIRGLCLLLLTHHFRNKLFVSSIWFSRFKKFGGDERNRTADPLLARQVLSQLSYAPTFLLLSAKTCLVGLSGLEPLTSRLSGVRSNQLSYRPFCFSLRAAPSKLNINQRMCVDLKSTRYLTISCLHRKEVIQPHLPIRLPCYDFTPIIEPTFGRALLAVRLRTSGVPDSHGVTGGVYKARERIHRGMLIRDY